MKAPWYYRCPFTNWLMAKPWQWNIIAIYKDLRKGYNDPDGEYPRLIRPPWGRIKSAWTALTFPHVHHESEDYEPKF